MGSTLQRHRRGTLHGRVEGLRDIRAAVTAVTAHLVELLVAGAVMVEPVAEVFLQLIRKTPGLNDSFWFKGFVFVGKILKPKKKT